MLFDTQNTVENGLESIIKNPNFNLFPNKFAYCNPIEQNGILFIGINPSISCNNESLIFSYALNQRGKNHAYFQRFEDISEYCKISWAHIDLLFFRETNQSTIYSILDQPFGKDFIWEQLQISNELIKNTKAKVIVVSNAFAGHFLGRDKKGNENVWLGYNFIFDSGLGTYLWNNVPRSRRVYSEAATRCGQNAAVFRLE